MADPKQIVEKIRGFLAATDQTQSAELTQSSADYSELCLEANARLARCADFLRLGLRSEAIQFADCNPPLLETVSMLDLPSIGAWEQICATYGLPRPVRLMMDVAKTLNDAYAEQEPIKPLLVKHRLLALTNAPLSERLSVLRQLALADAASPCWSDDVKEFERARISSLKVEAASAIRAASIERIDQLLAEITAEAWQSPFPEPLKASLSCASASLRGAGAIKQLQSMVPRVREAHAAMNLEECREVFAQWSQIAAESKAGLPDDLLAEIQPLTQLLERQNKARERARAFRTACNELAAALDANATAETLQQVYRYVISFEMELPEALLAEFQRRLSRLQRDVQKEKRRQFATAMVLVTAVALALIAMAWTILFSGKR